MKVEILDNKVFAGLDTNIIERYWRTHDWTTKEASADFSIWEAKQSKKLVRVWLPMDKDFLDFNEAIGRLVKDIAGFEDRSQLEVFEDLNTVAVGDVVRLTTYDRRNRESTTIPISEGLALVEKANWSGRRHSVLVIVLVQVRSHRHAPRHSNRALGRRYYMESSLNN